MPFSRGFKIKKRVVQFGGGIVREACR